jgi:hypothetical protein
MSSVDFFLVIKDFLFELISIEIKSDYENWLRNWIISKLLKIKEMKIQEILNPTIDESTKDFHYKTTTKKTSEYMLSCFPEIDNEDDDYFDNKTELNEEEKQSIVQRLSIKMDKIIECRRKYLLIDPIELLSHDDEERIKKSLSNVQIERTNLEIIDNPFDKKKLDSMLELQNIKFNDDIYTGYTEHEKQSVFSKHLIMTHSGVICELLNVICRCKGCSSLSGKDWVHNCSITIIRIYCYNCGGKCVKENDEKCRVEFDIVVLDEVSHLQILA